MQIEVLSQKQTIITTFNTTSINPNILGNYGVLGNSLNWIPFSFDGITSPWIKFNFITTLMFNSFTFSYSGEAENLQVDLSTDNINWNTIFSGTTIPTNQNFNISANFLKLIVTNPIEFTLLDFYIYATDNRVFNIPLLSPYVNILVPQQLLENNPIMGSIHKSYLKMWESNTMDNTLKMDPNYKLMIFSKVLNNRIGGIDSTTIDSREIE